MRATSPAALILAGVLSIVTAVPAARAGQAPAQPAAPTAAAAATTPHPITLDDTLAFRNISLAVFSSDGRWLAYRLTPLQGDSEVVLREVDSDREYRFPVGELPPPPEASGGPPPAATSDLLFSDDGQWLAMTVFPARKEAERLRRQRKPLQNAVRLVGVATGEPVDYPGVRQFAFSGESSVAIALLRYAPEPASPAAAGAPAAAPSPRPAGVRGDRPRGADLIVRDLSSGLEMTLGSVGGFAFDRKGRYLAWTTDTADGVGNGVSLRALATGTVRVLDSAKASYERLHWMEEGDALAVLRGEEDKAYDDRLYSAIGFRDLDAATPARAEYVPVKDAAFPPEMTISPNRDPEWTADRAGLLFGIHVPKKKLPRAGEDAGGATAERDGEGVGEKADLVLWHWRDSRLQSQQQVQEDRDRRFSYLAAWRIGDRRFLRLADEELREVRAPARGNWAVGIDRRDYELTGSLEGRNYQDVYAVDLTTGKRTRVARQVRWLYGQSPDGRQLLYFDGGHFHVVDLASGQVTAITRGAPVSFVDVEDDHNVVNPPVPPVGWTADSDAVLLSDAWDVWRVPASGSGAVNLTGNGRRDQVRYRRRFVLDPDEKGIDLSAPLYLDAYGEWTKKGGVARVDAGSPGARLLVWDDVTVARLLKARRADRLAFTRESWRDFPDYHVGDMLLGDARRVTDGQRQLAAFTWGSGARLVDYVSDQGRKLQGALFLPAGYQPGRKYPTLVYIYEKLSDQMNRFAPPTANGFNRTVYTSNGYAVLMPDITYTINDPGMSAVWCVLPALKAAVASGVVDAGRVGLQGHSWGGYQTSFLITQTGAFRAAVAGAPLTDMVSMYSLIYKNTGGGNMAIFESSQGRFKGGYWDNWDAYVRNSPIAFARNVTTPLVLLHNDRDGAVDFTQGVEYYNTLRRLKKPVVMLEYVGENHGLRKPANQHDYTVRMKEFFDHFLMAAPAPAWWTDGVPRLEMDDHLRQRRTPAPPDPTGPAPAAARP